MLLSFSLRRDSNCVDVGAHTGQFLTQITRVAPDGHHLAYEPLPTFFHHLANRFPDVDVRQAALSEEKGESSFVHVVELPGYSGLRESHHPPGLSTETITVRTERMDDDLPTGWLPDFVKIDVEGGEVSVMRGGVDTLRRAQPIVAFEHGRRGSEHYGSTDDELYRLLCDEVGLRLFDMDGNGPYRINQWIESLDSGKRWNWVAHP